MSNKIVHFSAAPLSLTSTVQDTPNKVTKKALVLYEGTHIDSKKKKHIFSADRIEEITENSNALFRSQGRIPLLKDHDKTQDSVIGDVESGFECAVIDDSNFPGASAKGLTGKLGIFVDEIGIKSRKAIQQLKEGLLNTISPGIDIVTNTIREISATPTPAITHVSMFRRASDERANFNTDALTWEDLEQDDTQMEQLEQQYYELVAGLWEMTKNIQTCDEDQMDMSCDDFQMQALQGFNDRFLELIGMGEDQQQEDQMNDPRIMQSNGGNPNFQDGQRALYSRVPVNAFSMADMEALNEMAEFGLMDTAKNVVSRVGRDLKSTGKAFEAGRKNSLGMTKASRNQGTKVMESHAGDISKYPGGLKRKMRGVTGTATTGDHIHAAGSGILNAGKKFLRTRTGKATAIAGAGLAAGGAAIAGYKALNRNKNKQS